MTDGLKSSSAVDDENKALWAYSLLTLSIVLFSSNHILARAVEGVVPPIGLSFWRWVVATVVLLPFTFRELLTRRDLIRDNWIWLVTLTFFLVSMGNTGVYLGLNWTTAINGGIIASAQPVVTFVMSWLLFREHATAGQALGLAVAVAGVLTVLLNGDLAVLLSFDFNIGDLWLIVSVFGFSLYAVLLRKAPRELSPLALLNVIQFLGIVLLAPFYVWESVYAMPMRLDAVTIGSVLWTGVMVGLAAMALWNKGIFDIGANKASVFVYLRMIFVTVAAIILLDETLEAHHLIAFPLIVAGIYLVTRAKPNPAS